MHEHLLTAIVLKSTLFEEFHRILTLFCQEEGLINVFVKNANLCPQKHGHLRVLSKVEVDLYLGKQDLYYYRSGRLLVAANEPKSFEEIQVAHSLVQTLLRSQYQKRASPLLYQLFEKLVEFLPTAKSKKNLLPALQLKILLYEDMHDLQPFSLEEQTLARQLMHTTSLQAIDRMELSEHVRIKISKLFEQRAAKGGT